MVAEIAAEYEVHPTQSLGGPTMVISGGYRRIRTVLRDMGYVMNKKRVLRLMRRMGIAGLCPGPNLSKRNHQHHTYPYLLRGVKAERADHIWGIDITYIRMKNS